MRSTGRGYQGQSIVTTLVYRRWGKRVRWEEGSVGVRREISKGVRNVGGLGGTGVIKEKPHGKRKGDKNTLEQR